MNKISFSAVTKMLEYEKAKEKYDEAKTAGKPAVFVTAVHHLPGKNAADIDYYYVATDKHAKKLLKKEALNRTGNNNAQLTCLSVTKFVTETLKYLEKKVPGSRTVDSGKYDICFLAKNKIPDSPEFYTACSIKI